MELSPSEVINLPDEVVKATKSLFLTIRAPSSEEAKVILNLFPVLDSLHVKVKHDLIQSLIPSFFNLRSLELTIIQKFYVKLDLSLLCNLLDFKLSIKAPADLILP